MYRHTLIKILIPIFFVLTPHFSEADGPTLPAAQAQAAEAGGQSLQSQTVLAYSEGLEKLLTAEKTPRKLKRKKPKKERNAEFYKKRKRRSGIWALIGLGTLFFVTLGGLFFWFPGASIIVGVSRLFGWIGLFSFVKWRINSIHLRYLTKK